MPKGKILIVTVVTLLSGMLPSLAQRRYDRGYDLSSPAVFAPKGSWMAGGTASYSLHNNRNYSFAVLKGINTTGYRLVASPAFCYMLKDNFGVGLRMDYGRNMLKVDSLSLNLGDIGLDIRNYHILNHKLVVNGILRNYIPLGNSRRFAMFNEAQLSVGFGQGKVMDGHSQNIEGSYDRSTSFGLNLCPGLVAFASEHLAVEFNVNMLGLSIENTDQTHNQVWKGNQHKTSVNFRVNVLSIGFGLYYYL